MVLAEIYITFEVVAFMLFLKALDREEQKYGGDKSVLYSLLSMGLFLTLAVSSFSIDSIFTGSNVTEWLGVGMNFGLGLISFIYAMLAYMNSLNVLRRGR